MQKKKFDLKSDIIDVNLEEDKEEHVITARTEVEENVVRKKNVLITVSVEEELRKEYKTWCARNGLQMNQAFLRGFELLKKSENI